MNLFPKEYVHGIFKGFSEGGLEFHAEIILPYNSLYQSMPMHGQFLLVQLENENEGVLGRITSISSEGRLVSTSGEDFGIRAVQDDREIPEDLRQQYLKYRIDIRVLGILRTDNGKCIFVPSHRRLPHVGSKVAFLSEEVLKEVVGHNIEGADIGFFALGEFIYGGKDMRLVQDSWMQVKSPAIIPKFNVVDIVSRRSFIFARAGYGKSNLVKLLFSNLYKVTPTIEKRNGRRVPVGTLIFDPDGEYFWPDDKNRPGLCDVPELKDQIVVFTRRVAPSPFYGSFVASDIKIDIRQLRPSVVFSIALSPERLEQQNVRKLMALNEFDWQRMVDAVYRDKNGTPIEIMQEIFGQPDMGEAEIVAARSNMTHIVNMLHDPASQMMDMVISALRDGKICIVDVSMMRGQPSLILSSLIIQKIFDINQNEFTSSDPKTIPTIAVVEEAQSILNTKDKTGDGPYIAWVKEGRKYDLGAVMITQQPGSIPKEILSQGDNWFIFHLLSSIDLQALKNANAHFSDDLLSTLLNEPIKGHCLFWSSSSGSNSYPIPIRVLSFENIYKLISDPQYNLSKVDTYASKLRSKYQAELIKKQQSLKASTSESEVKGTEIVEDENPDAMETYIQATIEALKNNYEFINRVKSWGMPWAGIKTELAKSLPELWDEQKRDNLAYNLVRRALDEIFGANNWSMEKRQSKSDKNKNTTWVVLKK
jgi:hypothetical protein